MKIRMLFLPGEDAEWPPTLINAVDEYTEGITGGIPGAYVDSMTSNPPARELFVRVPDEALTALFTVPIVDAEIDDPDTPPDGDAA